MTTWTRRFAVLILAALVAACARPAAPVESGAPFDPTADRATPTPRVTSRPPASAATTAPTQALVDFLIDRVTADPNDGAAQRDLGFALLQRIRETADPSGYARAETAFKAARELMPDDPLVLIGLGGLRLGQHEFAKALDLGRQALEAEPGDPAARAVVVDASIELGRYDAAFEEAEALARDAPSLATLARLSYARELQGDLAGALEAMRDAARSPGLAPENTAYVTALTGQLERLTGDPSAARASFDEALALVPDHPMSLAGLGRLAVGAGDLAAATKEFAQAASIVPLPEYVIALGETLEASGDAEGARRQYALARAEIALFESSGVVVDLELALFEADHGDPARALSLAQSAYDAAPTVRAADAQAWALHRLGRDQEAVLMADEALRLGSREPLLRFHAGAIAASLGRGEQAHDQLEAALHADPGFSATGAEEARRLLERLGG
jgi:tetratricopeptide (TPR) repeat protein